MVKNNFKRIYISKTAKQTRTIGATLAKEILKINKKNKKAFVLALEGDLGGGKTTFLQGLARGLKIKEKILSPTFVIFKRFQIPQGGTRKSLKRQPSSGCKFLCHLDCYRIKKAKEILEVGFKKMITDSSNIVAIEWADHISKFVPSESLALRFYFIDKHTRKIKLFGPGL